MNATTGVIATIYFNFKVDKLSLAQQTPSGSLVEIYLYN